MAGMRKLDEKKRKQWTAQDLLRNQNKDPFEQAREYYWGKMMQKNQKLLMRRLRKQRILNILFPWRKAK
jgi:hypothetical protein